MRPASPAEETYEEVQRLLHHVCRMFHSRHGGDYEELFSEANLAFTMAYGGFDPDYGVPFTHYLCNCVYRRLLRMKQNYMKQRALSLDIVQLSSYKEGRGTTYANEVEDPIKENYLAQQFEEMSDDASMVIDLILISPKDVAAAAFNSGAGYNPKRWKGVVRRYLRSRGWTLQRVKEAFDEIEVTLNDAVFGPS